MVESLIVEQFRDVIPASPRLIDAARTAVDSERVLQLITAEHNRITYPLELLLHDAGADWVVRDAEGRFRDGLRGFPMSWNGSRFIPDGEAAPTGDPTPGSGALEIHITTLHLIADPFHLGSSTEAAMRALTGGDPLGWGVAEPVTQPWSTRDITAHCQERNPSPTKLIVVGRGTVGVLHVSRVDAGLLEQLKISGPTTVTVRQDSIEALAAELAPTIRTMIVAAHPGRLDGLRSSAPTPPALPYGVLIGGEIAAMAGMPPAARVTTLGPAFWCRFDGGSRAPYEQLADILRHYSIV